MKLNFWKYINFVLSSVVLASCSSRPTTEERLLEQAFNAIKRNDWEVYSALTITYADFLMKAQHINAFNEKNSYAGGVMKPEQVKQQQEEFRAAVNGGAGVIDFKSSEFVSPGKVVHSGSLEGMEGPRIPYKIFEVVAKPSGGASNPRYPRFMIVIWDDEFRIMKLELPYNDASR